MKKEKKVLKKVHIACVSCGKDSLEMLHFVIANPDRYPLDFVVFVNTGMEFDAVYVVWERVKQFLKQKEIPYQMIDISEQFRHYMFDKEICKKGTKEVHRIGYGWCGGACRWGTGLKLQALNRFYRKHFKGYEVVEYVGIAADEPERMEREISGNGIKVYPLAVEGITEAECLQSCYAYGYDWKEDGVFLYDILDRLSCWCCRNKNLKELKNIFYKRRGYWNRLKALEEKIGEPMKGPGMSLLDLERRFLQEGYAVSVLDVCDWENAG